MAVRKKRKYSHKISREAESARCTNNRSFEDFVKEHNAAIAEAAIAEDEERRAAEDFAERHLIRMRRALGVME